MELSSGMRWSGVSMLGREVSRTLFTIFLARLIGPDEFGVAAQASVFIGMVSIFLDQGFSVALIQRQKISETMPGATASVNLAVGAMLTGITVAIAPLWASFMKTPQLTVVLVAFAASLLIRSAVITPRAMLMRNMQFRRIGIADAVAAFAGGLLGLAVAIQWANYWAVVVQVVGTDVLTVVLLVFLRAGYRPNLKVSQLRTIAGFSWRAFAAGILITSISQNIDNLLIGRVYGAAALAYYGLAYRLLLLPVQLAISSVGAVLLPAFSRLAEDVRALRTEMARATRTLATLAVPTMALAAAAAPQLVPIVFGSQWLPAVRIVQVLALVGALQATYRPTTTSLMLGMGRASLALRYAVLTTAAAVAGIVGGLPFGPFGVAVGLAATSTALLPIEWFVRRRLLGISIREQVDALLPAVQLGFSGAAAYLLVTSHIAGGQLVIAIVGLLAAGVTWFALLRLAHPALFAELRHMGLRLVGHRPSDEASVGGGL
ncbi:oligosaccharide flippase family protein [Skermania sp. ID1734]|uniref:oligosaccharide flippase family protein n=1 Tax=Skermania sp. ID1734 TaxID=2597516 RepID=UPI001180C41F|nr:oligosaccharide flippase family protein [Skermania sp. ID1734]TSD94459.1 oligosaccharide flippase family protein [Skermania sp. ID1734]